MVLIAELITLLVIAFSIGEHAQEVEANRNPGVAGTDCRLCGRGLAAVVRVLPPLVARLQRIIQVPQLSLGLLLGTLSWWWMRRR